MRSPDQRYDHYTRIPAPNPLVLARAAAALTRLSSDMPKESWVCAVRVKIAVRVRSAVHSTGVCTAAGARDARRSFPRLSNASSDQTTHRYTSHEYTGQMYSATSHVITVTPHN